MEARGLADDERITALEKQLAEAQIIAEDADRRYDEVGVWIEWFSCLIDFFSVWFLKLSFFFYSNLSCEDYIYEFIIYYYYYYEWKFSFVWKMVWY